MRIKVASLVLVAWLILALSFANSLVADNPKTAIRDFQSHIAGRSSYSNEQKQNAAKRIEILAENGTKPAELMADVLSALHPEFATGYASLRKGKFADAISAFKSLSESSDEYISRESTFYLANALVMNDDHEAAIPLLSEGKFMSSPHSADALFLLGICQKNLLQRENAKKTFADFLRNHPEASERQRNAAFAQFELLAQVQDGSLADIYEKMEFSRRRLALAKANEPTQKQQKEAVAILDNLIKQAEEREAVSESESKKEKEGSKSESKKEGKGGGEEGPGEGSDDRSDAKTVRKVQQGTEKSPWDFMRDKKRDAEALNAIKEKYPLRYRSLIEQYYRSLQDETEQ